MFGLPETLAFRVEQLFGRAQVIGDDGVEGAVRLLGNGVERARLKVPAGGFKRGGIVFWFAPPLFNQRGPLPEVIGCRLVAAFFPEPSAEGVIGVFPS